VLGVVTGGRFSTVGFRQCYEWSLGGGGRFSKVGSDSVRSGQREGAYISTVGSHSVVSFLCRGTLY
jgi:hypothetical protein